MWKGQPIPQHLCELVDEGKITLDDARAAADAGRRRAVAERAAALRREEREREAAEWRERQAEEDRMAMPWALFILAHCPARADDVVMRGWSIRVVVNEVKKMSGCDIGCGHRPLTAEHETQLRAACLAQGLSDEEADVLIAWNPQLHGAGVAS